MKGQKLIRLTGTALMLLCMAQPLQAKTERRLSDDQVKQQIVEESIAAYPGNCACPFNSARNGSRCGGRSAWSRQGGYAPLCYIREVTAEGVKKWREEHSGD